MKVGTAARLAWALWGLAMFALASAAWLHHLLRQAGGPTWPCWTPRSSR